MFKQYSLTIFSIVLFLNSSLLAQTKPPKSDKKETKKESKKGESKNIQVFDSKDDYDNFNKNKNFNPTNVLKVNPVDFITSTFPLFYERVVAPKVSVEVGLGVTVIRDFYYRLKEGFFGDKEYGGFVKAKTGLVFKIGARYYLGKYDNAPEGPYCGVEYQFKQYVFDALPYAGGSRATSGLPYQKTTTTENDLIRLLYGYQFHANGTLIIDPYLGIGWRKHTFNGWYEDNKIPILGSHSASKLILIFGVKMGFRF